MTDRADAEACVTRLLSFRDHCTGELRAKLRDRRFADELIEEVIADLVAQGYVDDDAFARHQARVLASQEWGPVQIRGKLAQHGVPRETAQQAVEDLDIDWVAVARGRLGRKFGELDVTQRERAYRHLVQRGFAPATARRAIFG